MIDIKPRLIIRLIPNVTSSALCSQSEILCICEPKGLDYFLNSKSEVNIISQVFAF